MPNIFIINGHEEYAISPGKLNAALVEKAQTLLSAKGYTLKITTMKDDYDIEEEIAKHQWADAIILQTPVNWMGVTWSFKKYMDYVYSSGLDSRLCNGDGRTRKDPSKQYGTGGTLTGKKYMLSLTFNAPKEAFNDPNQWLFEGKSVDDLFWPMHLNFRFFDMEPLPTFVCFDVMKNPDIENDFIRFESHLDRHFKGS
ncbi:MAG: NAD(P)H-dependent oxidoreductase [Roseofilum sp. SBFL]|uniref:NAD(P)H-dependent oxidoreductase n=1 Tax=Roseofilum sp. SBFL TaxID=2821496 RepID=UPI001B10FB6A|nr:NAD(P)H-dependent oxidoreductase [Roseofilum sp. SBFL]MBP0041924.1 NAD(P)H-dependent oxidoreductase [Roseofilum sp. SBFL]